MDNQLIFTILFIIAFLGLIAVCEILHTKFQMNAEYTRKLAHVASCLISLVFVDVFDSHGYVLFLALFFGLVLFLAKQKRMFRSIDPVSRSSAGSYTLPLAIYLCFISYLYIGNSILFTLPILITGISDTLAGISGGLFKINPGPVRIGKRILGKTWLGSGLFLISSFSISMIVLQNAGYPFGGIIAFSLITALLTAITELVTPKGLDNLTVPLSAVLVLIFI